MTPISASILINSFDRQCQPSNRVTFLFFLYLCARIWVNSAPGIKIQNNHNFYHYIYIYISSCRVISTDIPDILSPLPYRPLLPAGLQDYIPYRHRAAICMFELVILPLYVHVKGSTGVHHLWARPYFSSRVPHVWFVQFW